jgi:hypothetical protein
MVIYSIWPDIWLFSLSGIRLDIRQVKSGIRLDIRQVKSDIRTDTGYYKRPDYAAGGYPE